MRFWTLAFLFGVLLLQQLTVLPSRYWIVIILAAIFFLQLLVKQNQFIKYLSAFLFGFCWTLLYVHIITSWSLPDNLQGKPLLVNGYIASLPNNAENRTSFLFELNKIQNENVHAVIKLSLEENDLKNLRAGDEWQFLVKLKRIHGMKNPGGFDYEARALQEGILASGYVIKSPANLQLSSHWYHGAINRIRQKLKDKMEISLPQSNTSPWIIALALGERQNISADNWEVLRNTGTNHLMAIAGLHIGCMSGFIFFLVNWFWRRIPRLSIKIPAQSAGSFCALIMALFYAALAGFSLPAERTGIMLSVVFIAAILQRKIIAWQAWSIALFFVLLVNPLSVLTESFWLSFGTVALIIYGVSGRLNCHSLWWKLGRIQWVIAVGLIPAGIWLFQQFSGTAFIANCIAIPCVAFVIVPLTLLGCVVLLFSMKCGGYILLLADKLLAILWQILTWFSHLSWANLYMMIPNDWVLLAACVGIIILLSPSGFYGKWFGVIWLLPLVFYHYELPPIGQMNFTLLDVGQGLSAVIQTKNHILVFDTGAKVGQSYDMGESVVAPFLRSIGIKKIDMLVISHPDNDHIGGAKSLYHYFKILRARTSSPDELLPFASEYCLRGESWQWDGVDFKFLYPTTENLDLDNDSSCVLSVTNSSHKTILLTGDIEKFAEKYLIENEIDHLASDILVAPHHGSKTSALNEFVDQVHPQYVLFPVGYRNRYHFPHVTVIEKYQNIHANLLATDTSGAVQFKLNEIISAPTEYRLQQQRYWSFH